MSLPNSTQKLDIHSSSKTQIQVRQAVAGRLKSARKKAGYETPQAFCEAHHLIFEEYLAHEEARKSLKACSAICYAAHLNIELQWLMIGDPWEQWKQDKRKKYDWLFLHQSESTPITQTHSMNLQNRSKPS